MPKCAFSTTKSRRRLGLSPSEENVMPHPLVSCGTVGGASQRPDWRIVDCRHQLSDVGYGQRVGIRRGASARCVFHASRSRSFRGDERMQWPPSVARPASLGSEIRCYQISSRTRFVASLMMPKAWFRGVCGGFCAGSVTITSRCLMVASIAGSRRGVR